MSALTFTLTIAHTPTFTPTLVKSLPSCPPSSPSPPPNPHPFTLTITPTLTRNELERQFLELLQFNINVPSAVYAKYFFDLRTLAEANELAYPAEILSKERSQKLEAMSRTYEDKLAQEILGSGVKRGNSLDRISHRKSVAILS